MNFIFNTDNSADCCDRCFCGAKPKIIKLYLGYSVRCRNPNCRFAVFAKKEWEAIIKWNKTIRSKKKK